MNINLKLNEKGLQLPDVSQPGGSYQSVNIRGNQLFVAIQFPIKNGDFLYQGRLGNDITTQEGYEAMQLCALNVLAQVEDKVGFHKVEGLNHLDICYQAGENWDDSPLVANGASDLFLEILEVKGKHSRSIFGAHQLPRNFCVGLTASFTLV